MDTMSGFLLESRRQVLVAATARVLPSDDGTGAVEADVASYIERALQHPYNRRDVDLFERGLDFLQWLAGELKQRDLLACSPEEQDTVLLGAQEFRNNEARRFFERLVQLTLEGFLCDPAQGGNRGEAGWDYIGFAPERRRRGGCLLESEP
jgi:gluconate 2-dehydrogenase gamma chain